MKQKRLFLLLAIFMLVFSSLACGLFSGGKETENEVAPPENESAENPIEEQPEAEEPADKIENPAPPTNVDLGEEYRSEEGGYAFQLIPDYEIEEFFGLTNMKAPDADPDLGPMVILVGGLNEEAATKEEIFDKFLQDEASEDFQILDQREVTVGGEPGLLADLAGDIDGQQMVGRIVIVAVTPTQQFTMIASSPEGDWGEVEPLFDAVLASVYFFEPTEIDFLEELEEEIGQPEETPVEETPLTEGELIRQWGMRAEASSQYGTDFWAAEQATGEPDTLECGDQVTAWASLSSSGVDWLEITYEDPVIPTEINIYQTYNPDQVVQVEVIDQNGEFTTVYKAKPADWTGDTCPYILTVPVEGFNEPTVSLRIHVDQSELGEWNEIDAVELVGNAYTGSFSVAPPEETTLPGGDFPTAAGDLPPGGFAYFVAPTQGLPTFITEGTLQDQSTSEEYVIGLVSTDQQHTLTMFIPPDVATGFYQMNPYDASSTTKAPGGAVYVGLTLYTNTDGIIMIEEMVANKITGTIFFTAVDQDGNEVAVSGFFNQLPLGAE